MLATAKTFKSHRRSAPRFISEFHFSLDLPPSMQNVSATESTYTLPISSNRGHVSICDASRLAVAINRTNVTPRRLSLMRFIRHPTYRYARLDLTIARAFYTPHSCLIIIPFFLRALSIFPWSHVFSVATASLVYPVSKRLRSICHRLLVYAANN